MTFVCCSCMGCFVARSFLVYRDLMERKYQGWFMCHAYSAHRNKCQKIPR